jgi:hypothetical protein
MLMLYGTRAGKCACQLLKASCLSYTQKARSACFVPVDANRKKLTFYVEPGNDAKSSW